MKNFLSKRISRGWVRGILLILGALFFLSLGFSVAAVQYLSQDLPSPASIQSVEPSLKTLVFSADGDTLHEFFRENRTLVPLARIPRHLVEAVIATEDRRFYDHYGFDLKRFVKILWVNLTSRSRPGASTLTQQLARSMFLTNEKTIVRKLKELLLALQIEQTYTKDEILTMYLNQIFMGGNVYGMQEAAQAYFGRNVWELGPAETTMLAGIVQLPNHYSPLHHLDRAYRRRAVVLESMVADGVLAPAEADSLSHAEVQVVAADSLRDQASFAAYYLEEVRQELEQKYGTTGLYDQGLRVTTTLVPRYQHWMEEALESHLAAKEKELGYPMIRARYDSLVEAGERPAHVDYLQGAALLMDVRTGAILGMVGGRSFPDYKWNLAMQAPRQPGSVFKPIVYLTALQQGYTTASILMDTPFYYDTGTSIWRPRNFSGTFEGPVSLRYALSHSINTPTAKLYLDFGLAPVIENARRLGITSDLPRVPALFLGAGEVTLWDIVPAYATFADHGVHVTPHLIERVESAEGEILYEARIEQREVLDPGLAYLMVDLLHTTLTEGTGQSARWRGFTKTGAGKTGTTNDNTNAWFCGFTPSYCAGVWVGFDQYETMGRGTTGARMALPIWASFMGRIADEHGDEPFVEPPGIVRKTICARSGRLATSGCDSLRSEIFLPENCPQRLCDLHGGQLHDLSGLEKDFETLDRRSERPEDFR
jgi:penicillin-binding protein 1A